MKKSFFIFLGYVALWFATSILSYFAVFFALAKIYPNWVRVLNNTLPHLSFMAGALIIFAIYKKHYDCCSWRNMVIPKVLYLLKGAIFGVFMVSPIFLFVLFFLSTDGFSISSFQPMKLFALALLFPAAYAEELVFRYMGLSILQKHFTFWTSIIITSAVFSLVHVGQLFTEDHAVLQLFSRFIHGIFYSLVFRTGGLWLSTGVHWFWNVGVFALGFFPSHENTAFLTWASKIDEQVLTPHLVPYFLFVTILWCGSSSLKVTET